jgi:hypothetical protein
MLVHPQESRFKYCSLCSIRKNKGNQFSRHSAAKFRKPEWNRELAQRIREGPADVSTEL